MHNHILLEVYCTKEYDENINKAAPEFCKSSERIPGYDCLLNACPFATFTSCENALCYIDNKSQATKIISLGDESGENLSLWEQICSEKIKEAYSEYSDRSNSED